MAAFISHGDNFERQAAAFRRKLTRPAATDLRVEFAGGNVYDVEPQKLPSLYHGSPIRIYGRYKDAAPTKIVLEGDLLGRAFNKTVAANFPADDDGNPEIERMWAWHRIQRLMKEKDAPDKRDAAVDNIIRLGEGYSIVSEFTSFLVLENDAEYKRWKIKRRNALRIERDRRSQRELREELEKMRAKNLTQLGPQEPKKPTRKSTKIAANRPNMPNLPRPTTRPPTRQARAPQRRPSSQGIDFDLPGGGAIDPFTAGIALLVAGAGYAARRRSDYLDKE